MPDHRHERAHAGPVAGVDEAGRGPLAGPVVAAAVVLHPGRVPKGLNDSKRLSPAVRARLAMELADCAAVGIGVAGVDEIDTLNILRAAHLAMCRAIAALPVAPRCVLIDGNMLPRDLTLPGHAVVGGDRLSLAIAAASIVAKCHRDRLMEDLAQQHDGYGWTMNRGYGTPGHLAALERLGPTPQHRRSFAPVRRILWQEINPTP